MQVLLLFQFSTNGLVCMGCRYSSYTPVQLDTFQGHDIIAPFWSDLIVNASSHHNLYYHVYTNDDEAGNRTQIDNMLKKVTDSVNYYVQRNDFQASCVYIATWENAGIYGSQVRY